ncbi:ubiquitin carboxyl-terminal hydrolase 27 isoform X2 [Prosopis cineraria]|uniref:ubiquitin carboxyl-terminal hydrolase 27 isoform X2 n=1 Tax=Prosopis cineraria TaxID=364024 RepID=UPI00240EDC37|nr:ubiquitin carboxyl-terminal hydrolase 27 isoform X2 [Prosopis cineraria]
MGMERNVYLAALSRSLWHRFRTFSQISWPLASDVSVSIAALVSIIGAILAVRDGKMGIPTSLPWPFGGENISEKSIFIAGLQNLGNNCFLNVVLQTLASCSCFQTFLNSVIQEFGTEDLTERMPLTFALASLLQELSFVSAEKVTLSPQKVMLAMSDYIPNFNLTSQQDAAEAFLHLLCSLRNEFGDFYAPKESSLADSFGSNHRILTPLQRVGQTEWERWQQLFLGPLDGILGSTLTCQSCSSQISLSFESFDCLPLSPVLTGGSTIPFGRTLLDCLRQFIVAEHVENYHCSHCWHNAAIKYLSLMEGNETEIEKLGRCSKEEFCDCRKLYNLEKLPWSNRFSHTLKQLSIARCPRVCMLDLLSALSVRDILCIQLKRVSMNVFGEPAKLQGHISFPLILDLFPFTTSKLGIKIKEADTQTLPTTLQTNGSNPMPSQYIHQSERSMLKLDGICGSRRGQINSANRIDNGFVSPENGQKLHGDTVFPCNRGSSETIHGSTHTRFTGEVGVSSDSVSEETCLYQLVSVVQHCGKAGSGHYTVYRRAGMESSNSSDDQFNQNQTPPIQWFCVSDSEVHSVSEENVLSAEASLLFYEKIPEN